MEQFVERLWEQAASALVSHFRNAPRFEAHLSRAGAQVWSGQPNVWFNWSFVAPGSHAGDTLQAFAAAHTARGLPGMLLVPTANAARIESLAEAAGLVDGGLANWMACRPQQTPRPSAAVHVERVNDPTTLATANALMAEGFDLPPEVYDAVLPPAALDDPALDVFMVRRGDSVVSAAICTRGGAVAGIWSMVTSARHQHQGLGRVVLEFAMAYQQARGVELFFLSATDAGKSLYESAGFRTVHESQIWLVGVSANTVVH